MVINLDTYNKYYKKEKHLKPKITRYFSKILISIIFLLISIIYIKLSQDNHDNYEKIFFQD